MSDEQRPTCQWRNCACKSGFAEHRLFDGGDALQDAVHKAVEEAAQEAFADAAADGGGVPHEETHEEIHADAGQIPQLPLAADKETHEETHKEIHADAAVLAACQNPWCGYLTHPDAGRIPQLPPGFCCRKCWRWWISDFKKKVPSEHGPRCLKVPQAQAAYDAPHEVAEATTTSISKFLALADAPHEVAADSSASIKVSDETTSHSRHTRSTRIFTPTTPADSIEDIPEVTMSHCHTEETEEEMTHAADSAMADAQANLEMPEELDEDGKEEEMPLEEMPLEEDPRTPTTTATSSHRYIGDKRAQRARHAVPACHR